MKNLQHYWRMLNLRLYHGTSQSNCYDDEANTISPSPTLYVYFIQRQGKLFSIIIVHSVMPYRGATEMRGGGGRGQTGEHD